MSSEQATHTASCGEAPWRDAVSFIERKMLEGLKHGFFTLSIHVEMENQQRRVMTVHCGTSHRFVIRKEDIPR